MIESFNMITNILRRRILLELPRERSMAMYTLLKKLSTVEKSVIIKYFVPTLIKSSGVPHTRRSTGVKGSMQRTTAEHMPQIVINVLNRFLTMS